MQKIMSFFGWVAIALTAIVMPLHASAQQDTPVVHWEVYAQDTSLTYRQIVTACDSLFALAGITDTAAADTAETDKENSAYANYKSWQAYNYRSKLAQVWRNALRDANLCLLK